MREGSKESTSAIRPARRGRVWPRMPPLRPLPKIALDASRTAMLVAVRAADLTIVVVIESLWLAGVFGTGEDGGCAAGPRAGAAPAWACPRPAEARCPTGRSARAALGAAAAHRTGRGGAGRARRRRRLLVLHLAAGGAAHQHLVGRIAVDLLVVLAGERARLDRRPRARRRSPDRCGPAAGRRSSARPASARPWRRGTTPAPRRRRARRSPRRPRTSCSAGTSRPRSSPPSGPWA